MRANLLNCVRNVKSAGVKNVKLAAVRTGSDRGTDTLPTAGFLPPGQFLSRLPIPEQPDSGHQETAAMQRYPSATMPTRSVGSVPGFSTATAGAAIHSWSSPSTPRIGRDCQSPDRTADRRDRTATKRRPDAVVAAARVTAAAPAAAK